jgi:purine catabolism regulator
MMTVADVLKLPVVRRGLPELLAGERSLQRGVRWTHILDVHDISDLLRGGEFVLTTGLSAGEAARSQIAFVDQVSADGAAALAVELGTTFRRALPAPMISAARRQELPLIAFRRRVRFVEVTESIHRELMGLEFALLQHRSDLHVRFTQMILDGQGPAEILEELARTIANPVLLESPTHRLICHALYTSGDDIVLAAWQDLARMRSRGEDDSQLAAVAAVEMAGGASGRLLGLQIDSTVHPRDQIAVEEAAMAVALVMHRQRSEEELLGHALRSLIADLLAGRVGEDVANRRAAALDFPAHHGRLWPIVLRTRSSIPDRQSSLGSLLAPLRRDLTLRGLPVLAETSERCLLLIVNGGLAPVDPDSYDHIAKDIRTISEHHGSASDDLVVAIGRPQTTWVAAGRSLSQAVRASEAAVADPWQPWNDASRFGLTDLLSTLRDNPDLTTFIDDQLEPLVEHDRDHRSWLLTTLEQYLDHGCRKTDAARALHLQRQSLYHRLGRIEELLGVSLEDDRARLALHVALRARRVLEMLDYDRPSTIDAAVATERQKSGPAF